MAANVESMFYVGRQAPWHGLGVSVKAAPESKEALRLSGLDWKVFQKDIYTETGNRIEQYKANVRSTDQKVLGVVSDKYQVVQNDEAFAFTDALLGEGVRYETAGSLAGGKLIWLLARLPQKYIINGDEVAPYLVFFNSHDGTSAVRVAITPIRVVCQNTLNLALSTARRSWGIRHVGDINEKLHEARQTLALSDRYMSALGKSIYELDRIKLSDAKVQDYVNELFPVTADMSTQQIQNGRKMQRELKQRYYEAPDLQHVGKNGYRFINAVSDMVTHGKPLRETRNYQENLFRKTVDGNPTIDRAYKMLLSAA